MHCTHTQTQTHLRSYLCVCVYVCRSHYSRIYTIHYLKSTMDHWDPRQNHWLRWVTVMHTHICNMFKYIYMGTTHSVHYFSKSTTISRKSCFKAIYTFKEHSVWFCPFSFSFLFCYSFGKMGVFGRKRKRKGKTEI